MFFLFPVAVDYEARRYPVVTFVLMGINALFYLLSFVVFLGAPEDADSFIAGLGLVPAQRHFWTWFTSMFVHAGFFHFVGNMIYLFLFGACVEDIMGRPRFVAFYLAGGLFANLSQVLLTTDIEADIPIVGASGAISACIGAFLIVLSRTRINFRYFVWLFIRIFSGEFWLPARVVIAFWFLMDFASLILHLHMVDAGGGVAFGAHVGGTLAGALFMWVLRRKKPVSHQQVQSTKRVHAAIPAEESSAAHEVANVLLWFGGQQAGPYAPSQVRAMLELGAVPADACFWREGMSEWRPLAEL